MPNIYVGGQVHEVAEGAPFGETVKQVAREAGISHFRIYEHDGDEIMPGSAPETIVQDLDMTPFSVAA